MNKFATYLSGMSNETLLNEAKRILTLADIGLLYHKDEYDKERYVELKEIGLRLLSNIGGYSKEVLQKSFPVVSDYPTAKVDVRALVLSADKKILLVQESNDRCWSLPGGWAEVGFSPSETIVKECKEETGLDVIPKNLLAIFDKRKHPHPPELTYVFKMVFHCVPTNEDFVKGFDVLDVRYFDLEELPPLSENRILKSQIALVHRKLLAEDKAAYFD